MSSRFETEVRLSREMGLLEATMIGVGAMIGAGIFVLIGIAAGVAGPALLVAFLLNGCVALLTAMSYAELGSCFHDAGGGYLWVKEGLPKWNGFLSGWMSWFAHAVACSLYALGFGAYFDHVFRELGLSIPHWGGLSAQKILAVLVALLFAYVNFRGASEAGKIGNLITMAKIAILLVFIAFGFQWISGRGDVTAPFTPFLAEGAGGVFKAMGLTFIAFQGFEVIAQSSEEIRNPKKNIPRAVFLSLLIVVPIYLLVAIVSLGTAPDGSLRPWEYLAAHKELALVEVARNFFPGGGTMILIGGLISTMSALNATVYSSSRVAFAMGRDRNFPAFFSRVHARNLTPHRSIMVSAVIVVLMALSLPIEDVASAADIMFLLLFLQVNVALIMLRKKRPELDRGFSVPLFPGLTIVAILMLLFLAVYMLNYSIVAWSVTIAWIALGLIVYRSYAFRREIVYTHKVEALTRIERKDYSLLVCIGGARTAPSLMAVALAVARKHHGEMIFLHVVEVPEEHRLLADAGETALIRPTLAELEQEAADAGVPARSIIRIAHRMSQGIIDTAAEEKCNFVVLGRERNPAFLDRLFSSLIDAVLQQVTAETAILHGVLPPAGVRSILVPFAVDIHTRLALEVAPALADHFGARLQIAVIFERGLADVAREERLRQVRAMQREYAPQAELRVIQAGDVLRGIVKLSKRTDLIVMGGKAGDFFNLLLARSLTRRITELSACPVLWIKEYEELPSFWRSLVAPEDGERGAKP